MTYEEAIEQAQNKSCSEISEMYKKLQDIELLFKESCRAYISRHTMDNTEKNPYKCGENGWSICPQNAFGISSLEYPVVNNIYQMQGIIYFDYQGIGTYSFDDLDNYELYQIVRNIETINN